jgi:retinol dehydrogenase 14
VAGRAAVVTGATSGIGLETARGLAGQGWNLVLACRDRNRAEELARELASGGSHVSVLPLDLASLDSIRRFAADLGSRHPRVDLLVNNAGVFCDTQRTTAEGFEMTMGVNFLGTLLLTRLALPLLVAAGRARIVNVASAAAAYGRLRAGDGVFTRGPHGFRGYAASKLAVVMLTVDLAEELAGAGVTVNAVHPGEVATNIWRGESLLMRIVAPIMRRRLATPVEGARPVLHAALAPELEGVTGRFLGPRGELPMPGLAAAPEVRRELLRRAQEAVGLPVRERKP